MTGAVGHPGVFGALPLSITPDHLASGALLCCCVVLIIPGCLCCICSNMLCCSSGGVWRAAFKHNSRSSCIRCLVVLLCCVFHRGVFVLYCFEYVVLFIRGCLARCLQAQLGVTELSLTGLNGFLVLCCVNYPSSSILCQVKQCKDTLLRELCFKVSNQVRVQWRWWREKGGGD